MTAETSVAARRLHLLLAPKERFEPNGAGAFALNVAETTRASLWRAGITVFGSPLAKPFADISYRPVASAFFSLPNRNVAMARRYARAVAADPPNLIEIFNRPVMVGPLRRRLGTIPIALHFGNDPRGMDGSRTISERENLLKNTDAIICVSAFIRKCFIDGLSGAPLERVHVIHTGVGWSDEFPAAKENQVLYVGRITPEKGVLQLVRALVRVLPEHPAWSAQIIGAKWFGRSSAASHYEKEVIGAARECGQIVADGFRPHDEVIAALRKASIAVVPSCWDDPFPRSALEALSQGAALICSNRGGLPEIGSERALFVNEVSENSLAGALQHLISGNAERNALQLRGWQGFPFDIRRATAKLDALRNMLMKVA